MRTDDVPPSLLAIFFRCLTWSFVGLCFCIGQLLQNQSVVPVMTDSWRHPLPNVKTLLRVAPRGGFHRLQSGFVVINKKIDGLHTVRDRNVGEPKTSQCGPGGDAKQLLGG